MITTPASLTTGAGTPSPGELEDGWDAFFADVVRPFAELVLPFLAVLAALLISARLLTLLPLPWRTASAPDRQGHGRLGVALCVVAAALMTVVPAWGRAVLGATDEAAEAAARPRTTAIVLTTAAVLAVAGVLILANWVATRLRLTVVATGSDGSAAPARAAHIAALVGDLGARPSRGVEIPRGSDVSGLGDAVAAVPGGSWAAAVVTLVESLLGSAPWRVLVDEKSDGVVAVVVTRNGVQVASAPVDRSTFGLGEGVDAHRFSAAVVLTSLARAYPTEFDGLAGATDWRSLGLHYVATTDLRRDEAAQREALAQAVDLDPGNWLAQLAYRNVLHRHETRPDVIRAYRTWLTHHLSGPAASGYATTPGETTPALGPDTRYTSLRLRALYTRAALAVNEHFARTLVTRPAGSPQPCFATSVQADLDELAGELNTFAVPAERQVDDDLARLVASLRSLATPLFELGRAHGVAVRQLVVPPADARVTVALSPRVHYNRACTRATLPAPDFDDATAALRLAVPEPDLRSWLYDDPQLADYRKSEQFRQEFGRRPATDLLCLDLFERYGAALRTAGLGTPQALAAARPRVLEVITGSPRHEATAMHALAVMHNTLAASCDGIAVEVLRYLLERGAANPAALQELDDPSRAALAATILQVVGSTVDVDLDASTTAAVTAWLAAPFG
ncbi:hypothetical protein ABRQ22_03375 [Cellulosimicrobium sp. ES-005]|uniref:Bacterial transcriptional activator domain-containing protein n=1 Tax=Cellulosimicrobium sp. ES-005 TaxID=3163031 RepID=A0AAU8G1E7_9MICO